MPSGVADRRILIEPTKQRTDSGDGLETITCARTMYASGGGRLAERDLKVSMAGS
jgi:hypothetical protein